MDTLKTKVQESKPRTTQHIEEGNIVEDPCRRKLFLGTGVKGLKAEITSDTEKTDSPILNRFPPRPGPPPGVPPPPVPGLRLPAPTRLLRSVPSPPPFFLPFQRSPGHIASPDSIESSSASESSETKEPEKIRRGCVFSAKPTFVTAPTIPLPQRAGIINPDAPPVPERTTPVVPATPARTNQHWEPESPWFVEPIDLESLAKKNHKKREDRLIRNLERSLKKKRAN